MCIPKYMNNIFLLLTTCLIDHGHMEMGDKPRLSDQVSCPWASNADPSRSNDGYTIGKP